MKKEAAAAESGGQLAAAIVIATLLGIGGGRRAVLAAGAALTRAVIGTELNKVKDGIVNCVLHSKKKENHRRKGPKCHQNILYLGYCIHLSGSCEGLYL